MVYLVSLIVYGIIFGVLCSIVAKNKFRDSTGWFFSGFFFGIFGLIAILVMSPLEEEYVYTPTPVQSDNKKCPDCAEIIKAEAKVCRYCGLRFNTPDSEAFSNDPNILSKKIESLSKPEPGTLMKRKPPRTTRCPSCYTMNYDTELKCTCCGNFLPAEDE
jgi:hypothetical protein